jgi:hypothetical protein
MMILGSNPGATGRGGPRWRKKRGGLKRFLKRLNPLKDWHLLTSRLKENSEKK